MSPVVLTCDAPVLPMTVYVVPLYAIDFQSPMNELLFCDQFFPSELFRTPEPRTTTKLPLLSLAIQILPFDFAVVSTHPVASLCARENPSPVPINLELIKVISDKNLSVDTLDQNNTLSVTHIYVPVVCATNNPL